MTRRDAVENVLRLLRMDPAFSTWARGHDTLDAAWTACAEPSWMLLLLQTLGYSDGRALRLFAAACATRVRHLTGGGASDRALEVAAKVAASEADPKDLAPAYRAARDHGRTLLDRPDFSEAMAAAAAACAASVRERPFDAGLDASLEARRAVAWDLAGGRAASEEAAWQAAELRRLVGADVGPVLERARAQTRGKLALI
jgi:hypothetical protein